MFRHSSGKARILGSLVFLTAGTSLVLPSPFMASASPISFAKNLTVASVGPDVTALQQFLIAAGFSTKPTGYFGSLTRAALAAYQKAHAITPAVGYFGPLTRVAINASLLSPASTITTVESLPTTAANTNAQTGTVRLSLAPSPSTGSYIYTAINAPVYGLRFQVNGGPVTLNRFDVQVQDYQGDTVGTNAENPATFINVVKVWNGQNLIGSWNISPASGGVGTQFIQSSSDSSVYYVRLSGLNYSLPANTTTDLTVTFGTTGANDIDRTLVIQGYAGEAGTNVAIASAGATDYYGADGANFKVTQTFKGRINPIVSLTGDPSLTSGYGNYIVDSNNGLVGADLSLIDIAAEDGDIYITDLTANVTASGTAPTSITLYDTNTSTSTSVASVSPTGLSGGPFGSATTGSVSFHNLHIPVVANTTEQLDIQADMPGGIIEGSYVSVGDTNTAVTYHTNFGSAKTITNSTPGLYPSYFYTTAPTFAFVSGKAATVSTANTGSTQAISGTFVVTFTPQNSDMEALTAADITVDASHNSTDYPNVPNVSVDVSPAPSGGVYSRGQTYTATISAIAANSDLTDTGLYTFYLDGLNWTMANGVAVNPNYFFGNLVYTTNPVAFVK